MSRLRPIISRATRNLVVYRSQPPPINSPPQWDSQPVVNFAFGTPASVDFDDITSDPDLDAITHALNTGTIALPAGVTWTPTTGVLAYDGVGAAAQTTGHIANINDGTDNTDSSPFTITISSGIMAPLIGGARIGTRNWGDNPDGTGTNFDRDLEEMNAMGLCDVVVIGGQPALSSGRRAAMQDWLTWKTANHPTCFTYQYFILQETGNSLSGDVHDLLVSFDGPPGQTVAGGSLVSKNCAYGRDGQGNLEFIFAGINYATNITAYVVPDLNGDIWPEAFFETDAIWSDNYITPYSPGFDGLYCDVVDHRPRENGLDYKGTNSNNNARAGWDDGGEGEEVADAYREGHRRGLQRLIDNHGKPVSINGTTSPMESTETNPDNILNSKGVADVHPEYKDIFSGSWAELQAVGEGSFGFCGFYSTGTRSSFGSPRMAMNNYLYWMRHCIAPKHVLNQFLIEFIRSNQRNPIVGLDITEEAYQLCLFATAMTMMSDGLITLSPRAQEYGMTFHLDCWGTANTGTSGLGNHWIGPWIEDALEVRESALSGPGQWIGSATGVYKRRGTNGGAMVSMFKPSGNDEDPVTGGVTVPVVDGGSWANGEIPGNTIKKITGTQYAAWDDGSTINETNYPNGLFLPYRSGFIWENL